MSTNWTLEKVKQENWYYDGWVFNESIWPSPMKVPHVLGLDFFPIELDQIPFNCKSLEKHDLIENEFGDRLLFKGAFYVFISNDHTKFLEKWFCKWEKI